MSIRRGSVGDILAAFRHNDQLPPTNALNDQEQRTTPQLYTPDDRPVRLAAPATPRAKRALSRMYNSLAIENYEFYIADLNFRNGGVAVSLTNAALNSVALTVPNGTKIFSVDQWPDAVSVYYLIRYFSIVPTATGAAGDVQCYFVSATGGSEVSLGDFPAATGGSLPIYTMCPDAITDPSNPNVGTLFFNWLGGSGAKSFGFTLGMSLMYLLPARAENETPYDYR